VVGMSELSDQAIVQHTRHWIEEAVIGLNLCPFAKSVYQKGLVRVVVSQARHLDAFLDELDSELLLLRDTPASEVETTLLVHPKLFPDFEVFNDFLNVVDDVLQEHELEGEIQVAPFHPKFQFEGTEPSDISNATNWSPYPTLHLLREASIEQVIESGADSDAIVERNVALLQQMGPEGWHQIYVKYATKDQNV
jgi:hypothetical protein